MTESHNLHQHRYASSQHGHEEDESADLKICARHEATTCHHQFVHMASSEDENKKQSTSEKTASLIEHLEAQSSEWVAKFAAKVNGLDGGLSQKFIYQLTSARTIDARSDKSTAIAILEHYGR